MGGKRVKMFPNPIFPIFLEAADLPIGSLYKKNASGVRMGKWGKLKVSMGIRKFGYLGGLCSPWQLAWHENERLPCDSSPQG